VRRVAVLAQKRDTRLEAYLDGASPVVEADPDRLHQIGLILLDNALNHSPAGGTVRVIVRTENHGGVLEVEDSGEGIPAEQLRRVFDRFYRVDRARSRATGGSGLGLAIAETLVAAHGGRITLTPYPGGGVRATVWLPLATAEPTVAKNVSPARA
jgi:signal transduction histidine kinase